MEKTRLYTNLKKTRPDRKNQRGIKTGMQNIMDREKTNPEKTNQEKTGPKKTNPDRFATTTLAKLYADQGHYERAMAIYRRLEDEKMAGSDIEKAIERLMTVFTNKDAKKEQDMANLFLVWIRLVKRYRYVTES